MNRLLAQSLMKQRGAALIVSMLFLLIMTVLGISAMNTNILEEKMVTNSRFQNLAFQAADSCLSQIAEDPDNFTFLSGWEDAGSGSFGVNAANNSAAYTSQRQFHMFATPPRNSGFSAVKFQTAHNRYICSGTSSANSQVTLRQGIYQITPKF